MKPTFKRAAAIVLAALLALAPATCDGRTGDKKTGNPVCAFDAGNVAISYAAISDVHCQAGKEDVRQAMIHAIKTAQSFAGKTLDAVVVAGDITERSWQQGSTTEIEQADLAMFKSGIEEAVDLEKTAVIYALGNHDSDPSRRGTAAMRDVPSRFADQLGDAFFTFDIEKDMIETGNRHAVVGGFHFVVVQPDYYWRDDGYSDDTLAWLDSTMSEITEADPDAPVFVISHTVSYDTVFRSQATTWFDKDLPGILKNYPQTVYFSGHLHNPLQDERNVVQTDYTHVHCGSTKYSTAMNYVFESGDVLFDNTVYNWNAGSYSEGLLVQVDTNNNVRVTRLNFLTDKQIKDVWDIPAYQPDGSHLTAYTDAARKAANAAPTVQTFAAEATGEAVRLTVTGAADDDMTYGFKVTVKTSAGLEVATKYFATHIYQYDTADQMPADYEFTLTGLAAGSYELTLTAMDVWYAESAPLHATVTVG